MRAEITGVKRTTSKVSGDSIFMMFFKSDDGAYHTYIDPANRNYTNWDDLIKRTQAGEKRIILEGLRAKTGRLINADSNPTEVIGAAKSKRNTPAKEKQSAAVRKSREADEPPQQTLF